MQIEKLSTERARAAHIESIAQYELSRSCFREVQQIQASIVRDCILMLRGRVSSYYLKQLALAAVMHRFEGVVAIENEIEVDSCGLTRNVPR